MSRETISSTDFSCQDLTLRCCVVFCISQFENCCSQSSPASCVFPSSFLSLSFAPSAAALLLVSSPALPFVPMSPFHTSFRHSARERQREIMRNSACLCTRASGLCWYVAFMLSTSLWSLQDVGFTQEVLQPLVLMVKVPVLHDVLILLQHRLTLSDVGTRKFNYYTTLVNCMLSLIPVQ